MKQSQEERIDAELAELGIKAHITHLKQCPGCYYAHVTVATSRKEEYPHLDIALGAAYLEARVEKRSDLGNIVTHAFAQSGAGVALCHHLDNFSRKRGRIIAKGRLLKLMRSQL